MMGSYTPIAITGMGGRFPGDGDTLPQFWHSICEGKSAWSPVPKSRFNAGAFWSGSKQQNASVAQAGHFLTQDIAEFDANFFSFPKKDVQAMDPQHRMMVEVAYEAFENAGLPLDTVAGTKTGVFIGHFTSDYKEMIYRDPENAPLYTVAGACKTSLANRISWMWDLRGPSFSVDTACSSSLVALHLACQSLRTGESDIAVVGGTNLLLNPEMFRYLSNQSFLSPDGKCKSFDESANGYGRGEGCGCLVLKRADDAIAAGDPIRAVIRGTGSNQDGHTKGLTLPSAEAQVALIEDTYWRAGVDFKDVGYIEAHGTGTQAGDKTEVEAIGRTISTTRNASRKLLIGSVKSNVGHLEAAAGVASVIKSVFILENGIIPPSINFKKPNPKIKLDENNLQVASELQQWPSDGIRRISTNSFGYGGTNAHAILDDAYHYLSDRNISGDQLNALSAPNPLFRSTITVTNGSSNGCTDDDTQESCKNRAAGARLFVWSAQDKDGLNRVATALGKYISAEAARYEKRSDDPELFMADLAFTLSERRTPLQWKTYSIAGSSNELSASLQDSARPSTVAKSSRSPRLGFVFTGQGAQWPRMGIELMVYSAFRDSVYAADTYLRKECECPWSATVELQKNKSTSQLHRAEYSQALCTVLQVALVDLLKTWNIHPTAVAGHSSGEIGAAYAMGALTRENAWKTAYWRGVLSSRMKTETPELDGSMMAAGLSREEAEKWIQMIIDGEVVVACVNSPSSVTLSGDTVGIDQLENILKKEGIFARKLQVDTAYHSPHMQTVSQTYYDALEDLMPCEVSGDCTMHSSVTGTQIEANQLDAVNWVRNLISPVEFASAIRDMLRPSNGRLRAEANAIDILIEIGPHSALRGPSLQTLKANGISSVPYESVISRNENAAETAMALAASLYAYGTPVNITQVNRDDHRQHPKVLVDLPSYPWNHSQRYWHESRLESEYLSRANPKTHLLPAPTPSFAEDEKLWRGFIRLAEEPWIADHKIQGAMLYPAAGYIAMAVEAISQTTEIDAGQRISAYKLRDIHLVAAAVVSDSQDMECIVKLKFDTNSIWTDFMVTTSPDGKSLVKNCYGQIRLTFEEASTDCERQLELRSLKAQYEEAKTSCKGTLSRTDFYARLKSNGLDYGKAFACVAEIYNNNCGQSRCVLEIPDIGKSKMSNGEERPHVIFPGTLDAAFHLAFAAIQGGDEEMNSAMVPKFINEVTISANIPWRAGSKLPGFSNAKRYGHDELSADIVMMHEDEMQPCMEVSGFHCTAVQSAGSDRLDAVSVKPIASKVAWEPEIELLSKEDLSQVLIRSTGLDMITELLMLIRHSNPTLSVLEVVPKAKPHERYTPLLQQSPLDVVLRTANNVTIACGDQVQKKVQEEQTKYKSDMAFETVDFNISTAADHFEDRSYDAIIVPESDEFTSTAAIAAKTFFSLLKPGGTLCVLANDSILPNLTQFIEEVSAEVSLIRSEVASIEAKNLLIFRRKDSSNIASVNNVIKEPLFIIHPPEMSIAGQELSKQLHKTLGQLGYTTSAFVWGNDISLFSGKACISLLELEDPFLQDISRKDFASFKSLVENVESLFWVTGIDEPCASMVNGIARVVRSEMPNVTFRTFHIGSGNRHGNLAEPIGRIYSSPILDDEFVLKDGILHTSRIEEDLELNEDINSLLSSVGSTRCLETTLESVPFPLKMSLREPGRLDSLFLEADEEIEAELMQTEVEIKVKATALSLKDTSVGNIHSSDTKLGREAAGIVLRVGPKVRDFRPGDRVVMYGAGAQRSLHRSRMEFCALIGKDVAFEQAVTSISTYGTAWNALVRLAQIREGQSILIHSATSATGRAAIRIAKHYGLEIFATISSDAELRLLRDTEDVATERIFNENGSEFLKGIKRMTHGRGVDVVLNTLSGEALRQTWCCVADFGYFVELGDANNTTFQSAPGRNITYTSFDLDDIARERPEIMATIIRGASECLQKSKASMVTPSFPVSDMMHAMRQVQSGKVSSPSCLTWNEKDVVTVVEHHKAPPKLQPAGVYLLVGGLGGLGRSLASKLVQLGARKLAFLSRSGAASPSAQHTLHDLNSQGVEVKVYRGDVADAELVADIVTQCSLEFGEIRGVFQCAMVLRDVLFANMSYEQWVESTRPKVQGSWNLHQCLPDVDFFITLSSFSAIFGNPGQSNYASGGAFEDGLAHYRRAQGQRALTLDLGIMRDIGVLAETGITESLREWEALYGITEPEFHALLEIGIAGELAGNISPQIVTGLATGESAMSAGITPPFYFDKPQFSIMARTGTQKQRLESAGDTIPTTTLVSQSTSLEEAAGHITDALVMQVSKLLEAPASEIDTSRFLHSFGIDSLSAIRIVTWALKELSATITVFDVLASVPMQAVASKIAIKSTALPKELVPL